MKIFKRVRQFFEQRSVMNNFIRARYSLLHGETASAIRVTPESALKFSAVFASVRILAETKASLPIHVYERNKDGTRSKVNFHPVADLLHNIGPNDDMTPMIFHETLMAHRLLWGNSYAELQFGGRGEVVRAVPLHPSTVEPFRDERGQLEYRVQDSGGGRILDRSQILHVPCIGGNGIVGWSPIKLAAESIGIGLANERFAAKFFANSMRPSMVVEHPGKLGDEAFGRLKEQIETQATGDNAHKPIIFEGGMKANVLTMPLNEAQFLESRKFQGEEIASRIYRLPPHVAGYLDRAHFSNIEAQDLYFEKHTMRPHLERDEQELNRKLFTREERRRFYVKHNVSALLRADIKTRYESHKTGVLHGFSTINEIREAEDLNPIGPAGDVNYMPLNHATVEKMKAGDSPKSKRTDDNETDQRLATLTERMLSGLLQREETFVARAQKTPSSFESKVVDFYRKQEQLLQERLGDIVDEKRFAKLLDEMTERKNNHLQQGESHAKN